MRTTTSVRWWDVAERSPRAPEDRALLVTVAGACAAAAAWTLVFALRFDDRMATDSRSFAETAERLAHGQGFAPTLVGAADAQAFDTVHFPPGLPIVLSLLMRLGLSAFGAALVVNLVSWAATVAGCAVLYRRAGGEPGRWFVGLMGWLVLISSLVGLNGSVWSEPLFLALVVWFLVACERWLGGGGGWRWGLVAVVLGAGAISVRYVGVCLVVAAAIRVLQQGGGLRRIAVRGAAVAATVVPLALWYLAFRERARVDAPGESDYPITFATVVDSLGSLGSIVSGGIVYAHSGRILGPLDPAIRPVLVLAGAGALAAGAVLLVRSWRTLREGGHLLIVDYVVVSTAFLFGYRILSGFAVLSRYWIVVVVPLVPLLVAGASRRWPAVPRAGIDGFLAVNLVMAAYFYA